MSCLGECLEMGPPPDNILWMPPPPAPAFLPDILLNTTPCTSSSLCNSLVRSNKVPDASTGDLIELSRKDVDSWSVSSIDDTWLLVLVASSIGVLLLGALLAMFLLKCREMNMFGGNDCSIHTRGVERQSKYLHHDSRDCSSVANLNGSKLIHPTDSALYHGTAANMPDNRMVWAALTPQGRTHHFISENYPRDLVDYGETGEDHYETIDNIQPVTGNYHPYAQDYEYEDPSPLIDNYPLNSMQQEPTYALPSPGNTDMRCANMMMGYATGSMRSSRPKISSPSRIENPNLPPLNLYPHKSNTIKRSTLSYRHVDTGTLPKYAC